MFSSVGGGTTGVRGVERVRRVVSSVRRYRCVASTGIADLSLKGKCTRVTMSVRDRLFCGIVSRRAKLSVARRCRLLGYVGALSRGRGRFSGVTRTCRRIRRANCKVIVPAVSRLALSRPRVVGRDKGCNVGLETDTPSVRVVGVFARARMAPVINSRRRSRRLISCLLERFSRGPRGV